MSGGDTPVVIVAGAGGIGAPIAAHLGATGRRVVILDIAGEAAEAVAAGIVDAGGVAVAMAGDVSREETGHAAVETAVFRFGRLDGLVNASTLTGLGPLLDFPLDLFDRIIGVNLRGALVLARAAASQMKTQPDGGSIVQISSVTSLFGAPGQAVYGMTKTALSGLVKSMAIEWASAGIRVNGVSPTTTDTPLAREWLDSDPSLRATIEKAVPLGRLARPEDLFGIVDLLLGPNGNFITGQTVYVDGGISVTHPDQVLTAMGRIIDSHIHVWDVDGSHDIWVNRDIAALQRDATLDDFTAAADADRVILVQAASSLDETEELCLRHGADPRVAGVVGWCDLEDGTSLSRLDALAGRYACLKGIRVLPAFDLDGPWRMSAPFAEGLRLLEARGLSLDILLAPSHLEAIPHLLDAAPCLRIMINHCGRPLTMCGLSGDWLAGLRRAADTGPTVYCKLSGLIERAGFEWQTRTVRPFIDHVVACFGPRRTTFASNWPMPELTGTWRRWHRAVLDALGESGLSGQDLDLIFAAAAEDFYRTAAPGEVSRNA